MRFIEFCRPLSVSILSERRTYAPYGLNGGENGLCGLNLIKRGRDGTLVNVGCKRTYEVEGGDTILLHTPGGGGYGNEDEERRENEEEKEEVEKE